MADCRQVSAARLVSMYRGPFRGEARLELVPSDLDVPWRPPVQRPPMGSRSHRAPRSPWWRFGR